MPYELLQGTSGRGDSRITVGSKTTKTIIEDTIGERLLKNDAFCIFLFGGVEKTMAHCSSLLSPQEGIRLRVEFSKPFNCRCLWDGIHFAYET